MTQAITIPSIAVLEKVVIEGDLAKLTARERVDYYRRVCESVGLNPFTKPFLYITLNGKLTLYATRDCGDQLRRRDGISVSKLNREVTEGMYVVTAEARTPDGRTDSSIGAVPIDNLKGEARANAMMKAETKAKRRVTLSICGLGWLDETETDTTPDAMPVNVDIVTGEIMEPAKVAAAAQRSAANKAPTSGNISLGTLRETATTCGWSDEDTMHWLEDNGYVKDGRWLKGSQAALKVMQQIAEVQQANAEADQKEELPY